MHIIYKDKEEDFECKIAVEGADLSNAKARLILENNNQSLLFNGIIDSEGNCKVHLGKLKVLPEHLKGTLKLEVIVDEDTYFVPYQDEFVLEVSKKVTVEVVNKRESPISKKKVTVEIAQKPNKLVERKYTDNKAENQNWTLAVLEARKVLSGEKIKEFKPEVRNRISQEIVKEIANKYKIPTSKISEFKLKVIRELTEPKKK
jgi:hypothetical protein